MASTGAQETKNDLHGRKHRIDWSRMHSFKKSYGRCIERFGSDLGIKHFTFGNYLLLANTCLLEIKQHRKM
jgi:hypothetical protein